MHEYSPLLMVSVLRKDYPEIAELISQSIRKSLPEERLTDLSKVDLIIDSFKKEFKLECNQWVNKKGSIRITERRDLLIAIILLFYSPERLMQLIEGPIMKGVATRTANILGTSQEVISSSLSNVIVAFKAYKEFRNEVYRLYELIKIENKFFE